MSDQESLNTLINDGELPPDGNSKTEPPINPNADHGFLEGWLALSSETYQTLKDVIDMGLTPAERVAVMKTTIKFFALSTHGAKEEDFSPEAKQEIETLLFELESSIPNLRHE